MKETSLNNLLVIEKLGIDTAIVKDEESNISYKIKLEPSYSGFEGDTKLQERSLFVNKGDRITLRIKTPTKFYEKLLSGYLINRNGTIQRADETSEPVYFDSIEYPELTSKPV